jgi:hypothetical protein
MEKPLLSTATSPAKEEQAPKTTKTTILEKNLIEFGVEP